MGYGGLTAFMDTDDIRSHRDWLEATLYARHPQLWKTLPEDVKADIAALMDKAAERAIVQRPVQGREEGGEPPV